MTTKTTDLAKKGMTVRERLIRAGVLLPAPRLPEPRAEDQVRGGARAGG